jgi:hypothetical protein
MFEDSQFDIFIFGCAEKLRSQSQNLDYSSPIARYMIHFSMNGTKLHIYYISHSSLFALINKNIVNLYFELLKTNLHYTRSSKMSITPSKYDKKVCHNEISRFSLEGGA